MKDNLNSTIGGMNILIVDDVHELLPNRLREVGNHVLYLPEANRQEILEKISDAQILVIRTKTKVDKELMEAAPKLLLVARAGAGLDNIDLEYAKVRNIQCVNAGEANSEAVGEHALGLLLMLLNHLSRAHAQVKTKIWLREENRGVELYGKSVGIIGFGNTGSAFARKLSGMGVKILAFDKYLSGYGNEKVLESTWQQLFEEVDIISFHVPLTGETEGYFDATCLNQFKKPIYLLNLSRGKVVKTEALIEGLKNGRVLGCALDVLENEDIKSLKGEELENFEFLIRSEKVVLTPHIGGWTKESYHKISSILLDKLLTFSPKNEKVVSFGK